MLGIKPEFDNVKTDDVWSSSHTSPQNRWKPLNPFMIPHGDTYILIVCTRPTLKQEKSDRS